MAPKKFWPSDLEWRTPKMRSDLPSTPAMVPANGLALVKLGDDKPVELVSAAEDLDALTHEEAASAIRSPAKAVQAFLRFLVRSPLIPLWICGKLAKEDPEMTWSHALRPRERADLLGEGRPWVPYVLIVSLIATFVIPFLAVWRLFKDSEDIREFIVEKGQKVADVVFGKEPL